MSGATSTARPVLVQVERLVHRYPVKGGFWRRTKAWVPAVDDVSFDIAAGETMGLVGETGSGKTTLGRCLIRLLEPASGRILFDGEDLLALEGERLRTRRRDFQIIFQDPYGSLNPRMRVADIVAEPLLIHRMGTRRERLDRVADLLRQVGLDSSVMGRFPHEFSGGQCQRIGIARALALNPKFIVCDEPVSALDVSVQAQIVNLMQDLQDSLGLTYLFIAHGLGVVAHISTRTAVMYSGGIVEIGPTDELFVRPLHPYTKALLSAVPKPDPADTSRPEPLKGEPSSAARRPSGCRFASRCPIAEPRCRREEPELRDFGASHLAACHLAE